MHPHTRLNFHTAINDCNTRKKRGMLNSYVGNAVCSEIDRRREVRAAQTGNAAVNKLKVTSTTDNDNADSASNAFISFGLHGQKERSAALSYSSSIITQDSTGSGSVSNSGMNDAKHAIVRRWVESAPEHRVRRVDRDMHRGLYAASNIPIFDADDGNSFEYYDWYKLADCLLFVFAPLHLVY